MSDALPITPAIATPGNVYLSNIVTDSFTINWQDNSKIEDGYAIYLDGDQVASATDIPGKPGTETGGNRGQSPILVF